MPLGMVNCYLLQIENRPCGCSKQWLVKVSLIKCTVDIVSIGNIIMQCFLFRRDPKSLVKPKKEEESNDEYNEKLKKVTPTVSRHLILIRHGQYEMKPDSDKNRVLTALGIFSYGSTCHCNAVKGVCGRTREFIHN